MSSSPRGTSSSSLPPPWCWPQPQTAVRCGGGRGRRTLHPYVLFLHCLWCVRTHHFWCVRDDLRFYLTCGQGRGQVSRGMVSPMGLSGTTWDCGTRLFPCGIVPQWLMSPRHGTARGAHEGGALDFGRGGPSAASSKMGKPAAPGCVLQGGTVRFVHIGPTHVGMVRAWFCSRQDTKPAPHACGDGPTSSTFGRVLPASSPRMWGAPVSGL